MTTPEASSTQQRVRWIPRFRFYTIFVFVGLSLFVPILDFIRYGLKGDFWWVWNSGRWMANHHRVLMKNPAAWNGTALAGKPWVDLEWAWEWFIYVVDPHLHPLIFIGVLFVFEVLMLLAFLWTIEVIAPQLTKEATWGLYALYSVLLFPFTIRLRAELFSYAAFPFLLGVLWRSRKNPRWLWVLSPLTLVWANIHGSWLMILVLSFLEVVLSLWNQDWRLAGFEALGGMVAPVAIVTALTPFHLQTLTYAWWLDHNSYIIRFIQEWQSINFHETLFLLIGGLVFLAWLWRARFHVSYPFVLDLWFVGITLAFFDQIRMIPYFGMVFVLWMGYGLGKGSRFQEWLSGTKGTMSFRWAQISGMTAALAASLLFAGVLKPHWVHPVVPDKVSWAARRVPHQVVLAPIDDGGYLEAHGVSGIYADGRSDFFLANGQRFQDYVTLVLNTTTPASRVSQIFSAHHINMVVWPNAFLLADLRWYLKSHHWHQVVHQGQWAVWVPDTR